MTETDYIPRKYLIFGKKMYIGIIFCLHLGNVLLE